MKKSGEAGQIFRVLHEKQRAGWKNFQKLINGHAHYYLAGKMKTGLL